MFENPEFWKAVGYVGLGGGYLFLIYACCHCFNDGRALWKREMNERLEKDKYFREDKRS